MGINNGRKAAHHLLLGHGLAMQVLQKNSPNSQNGIVLNFTPCYSFTDKPQDIAATQYADDYINLWYMRPIMEGKYPDIIDTMPQAQRPDIHDGDMDIIAHGIDFLGINFYTRVKYVADEESIYKEVEEEGIERTDMGWEVYPKAFSELLISLNEKYQLPPVFITENGAAMPDKMEAGQVNDDDRLSYYQRHLNAVNDAIEVWR